MKVLAILCLALLVSGCATVTRGRNQKFTIETEPPGAEAQLSTGQTCVTPCTLSLPRKSKFSVTIKKEGYKDVTSDVTNEVSGGGAAGFLGNALIGGLIGAGLDAASGATLNLKPNPLALKLEADTPTVASTAPSEPTVAQPTLSASPPAASSSNSSPPPPQTPPPAASSAPENTKPDTSSSGTTPSGEQPSGGAGV